MIQETVVHGVNPKFVNIWVETSPSSEIIRHLNKDIDGFCMKNINISSRLDTLNSLILLNHVPNSFNKFCQYISIDIVSDI
jgi:hypothetical protein